MGSSQVQTLGANDDAFSNEFPAGCRTSSASYVLSLFLLPGFDQWLFLRFLSYDDSQKGKMAWKGVTMALDWSQCPAVESVPGKLSGAWVFRGTRMPVATVFENLEDGMTIDEIIEQFDVTREQVAAVLDFAARSLEAPVNRY